jgi:hypothetical protein
MFIPDPDFYPDLGSRIQKQLQKRGVKKNVCIFFYKLGFFCGNCKLTCMSEHWDPQVAHCHLHHTETEANSPAHKRILIFSPSRIPYLGSGIQKQKRGGDNFSFLTSFVATNITKLEKI